MKIRPKIRNPQALGDAQRLVQVGADADIVLIFLRDRGFYHTDCIYAVETLYGKQFSDAKSLVVHSQACTDRYESDVELRNAARRAVRQVAASNSSDLP